MTPGQTTVQSPRSSPEPTRLVRVGLLVGSPKIGGAERQVWRLAHGIREAGQEARVLFMERRGRRPRSACIDFGSVPHAYLGAGRGTRWLACRRLRHHADDLDALLAFNLDAMELMASTLGGRRRPLRIGSVRGLGFTQAPDLVGRLRRVCERLDAVTCNSPAIARALDEHGILDLSRVSVLPNIVPASPAVTRPDDATFRVLFVGNLLPVKQPELFVRACLRAMQEVPRLRATIAGDGPLRGDVERLVAANPGAFELLGHVQPGEVPFGDADVVVSTSVREGSSNALLEAMACGCPVIATRAGGNIELLDESRGGILVPVDGETELAAALVRLASNPELRDQHGSAGHAYVASTHGSEHVVRQLMDLIRDAAGRRANG